MIVAARGRRLARLGRSLRDRGVVFVYAGPLAWEKAKSAERHGVSLVMAVDADPFATAWPVKGRSVTVSWPGGRTVEVKRLNQALIEAGAVRVVTVAPVYADSSEPSYEWAFNE